MADQPSSPGQGRFPFLRKQQGYPQGDGGYNDGYNDGGYDDNGYNDGGYNDGYGNGANGGYNDNYNGGGYSQQGGGRPAQYADQTMTQNRPAGRPQRPQNDAAARAAAAVANANAHRGNMGGGTATAQRPAGQQNMPGRMMPPRSPMRGPAQGGMGRPMQGGMGRPVQGGPARPMQGGPAQGGQGTGQNPAANAGGKPPANNNGTQGGNSEPPKKPVNSARAAAEAADEEDVKKAKQLANSMSLPYVNLDEYQVDKSIVGIVPPEMCRKNDMLPIDVIKGQLAVACADPTNFNALDDISAAAGMNVLPMVTTETKVKQAIQRFLRANDELKEISDEIVASSRGNSLNTDQDTDEDAEASSPVARFVSLVINQAIDDHCSDIHIEPQEKSLLVRFRIDGVLHEFQRAPAEMKQGVISRIKVLSDMDIGEHRKPQDGRITVRHNGTNVDLRVAALPTVWGEKIVMRILSTPSGNLKVEDLNFSERNYKVFKDAYSRPYGMVLVTGPTGSGKSTTLYATLGDVAKPEINVITVEDPVEFRMPGINQVQVNKKAGLTFAAALRSILRADPDVVLIGEIRDAETATIATEAALTGHLVLSTLHTNDAPSAVSRMTEMGVEPFLISSSLCAVTAQRLARRLCKYCKEETVATPEQVKLMDPKWDGTGDLPHIFKAHEGGCKECSGTGYRGRVSVQQVMGVSTTLESMIAKGATTFEIQAQAEKEGMTGLRDDGWEKVKEGITTVDEIIRVTV